MDKLRFLYDFFCYLFNRAKEDELKQSAAALTYLTLFALVPIMTVAFTIFANIPAFDSATGNLQSTLFEHFIPSTSVQIEQYLSNFTNQAQKLSGIGIIFIAVTSILMLRNIENAFNKIWRTPGNRKGLTSILVYWAVLSLGPLLLGAGLMISTYLTSLSIFTEDYHSLGFGPKLLNLMPLFTSTATFMLLFYTVPNTKVPLKHALAGGLLTALAFEVAKKSFAVAMAGSSYQVVYGAFAAVPLFLLWVFLSWLILLSGAEFTRALSGYEPANSRLPDIIIALSLLKLLHKQHKKGLVVSESMLLKSQWSPGGHRVSSDRRESIRNRLIDHNIIKITHHGDYVLGQDLQQVSLFDLQEVLHESNPLIPLESPQQEPWLNHACELLTQSSKQQYVSLNVTLESVLEKS